MCCVNKWCKNRATDQVCHQIIKELLVDGLHLAFKLGNWLIGVVQLAHVFHLKFSEYIQLM